MFVQIHVVIFAMSLKELRQAKTVLLPLKLHYRARIRVFRDL
jgi:hypothetical protein